MKIAIIHSIPPNMGAGAEIVCYKLVETLKNDHELTLISPVSLDFDRLNSFFNLQLKPTDFKLIVPKLPFSLNTRPGYKKWKMSLLSKFVSKSIKQFDLVISTSNEINIPGSIQYIHFPDYIDEYKFMSAKTGIKTNTMNFSIKYKIYSWFYRQFLRPSKKIIKENITIVNSNWTANVVKDMLGVNPEVIYPPVEVPTKTRAWSKRKDGFICIGIGGSKHTLDIIEILKRLNKARDKNLTLDIVGVRNMGELDYFNEVLKQVKQNSWITLHESVSRKELEKILESNKYGIHGYRWEHFGIAVAEMVNYGLIPFVPDHGGQVEIVNNDKLVYSDVDNAVKKISKILYNTSLQKNILKSLSLEAKKYSVKNFKKKFKKIVEERDLL